MSTEIVSPVKIETSERQVDSFAYRISDLYTLYGLATREIPVPGSESNTPRSPYTRLERGIEYQRIKWQRAIAKLVNKFPKSLGREDWLRVRPSDRERLGMLDEFDKQFQDLKEIDITTKESGHQPLSYSEVKLTNKNTGEKEAITDEDETVTFIIPAWSGTIYGVDPLARALAEKGERVFTFNYPESHLGKGPSEEFTQKMKESFKKNDPVDYNPHTAVFKAALQELAQGRKIRLVSYSTGGPIVAEMLQDPEFSKNVELAIILSPASAIDQNKTSLETGSVVDLMSPLGVLSGNQDLSPFKGAKDLLNTGIVIGSAKEVDPEIAARKKEISDILEAKVCKRSNKFETARVSEGGKIVIQTGPWDMMTKSEGAVRKIIKSGTNPQAVWLDCPGFSHTSPLLHAKEMLAKIDMIAKNPNPQKIQRLNIF